MGRVLPHLLRLRGFCLNVLHSCFIRWTKPVLATCHIYPLNEASENTFPRHSHLADSPESG
jgi:hypothetical protein